MIENTLENKAKFFGLYLLQRVFKDSDCSEHVQPSVLITPNNVFRSQYLVLKPLSSISIEEAIEVFNITSAANIKITVETRPSTIRVNYDYFVDDNIGYVSNYFFIDPNCIPYICALKLIRMGYYVGEGTEIEYGWVRLKGEVTT